MNDPLVTFAIFTLIILIGIIIFTGCLQSTAMCITALAATSSLVLHQVQMYKMVKEHHTPHITDNKNNNSQTSSMVPSVEEFKEGPLQIASKKEDEERSQGIFKGGYVPTDDPITDALAGIEEVHSLPMYSRNQSLLSNLNWRKKQEARYQGYMDLRRIDDHKMRFRMNKSRDGQRRAMNSESAAKYFNEELHEREQSQWWGI